MANTRSRSSKPTSPLLEAKEIEDILNPKALPFEYDGKTYGILPMPDSSLMLIADSLSGVASVVDGIGKAIGSGLTAADLVPAIPDIIRTLLPNASKLIGTALGESEAFAQKIPLAKKLEALRLIIQAEDLPLILGNWNALVATFRLPEPLQGTPQGATASTEDTSTTS